MSRVRIPAGPNALWRWVKTHPARTKRHTAPHRHRVVGKTLVVAGDQRNVHRLARLEPIGRGEQSLVHLTPQTIHLVVLGSHPHGRVHIPRLDHRARLGHEPTRHLAHPLHLLAQAARHHAVRMPRPDHLREVAGQGAHAFQVGIHAQHGHDGSQVARHRLLAGDQVHRRVVDLGMQTPEGFQYLDHHSSMPEIGIQQGRPGSAECRLDQPGERGDPIDQGAQLRLVHLSHRPAPFVGRTIVTRPGPYAGGGGPAGTSRRR